MLLPTEEMEAAWLSDNVPDAKCAYNCYRVLITVPSPHSYFHSLLKCYNKALVHMPLSTQTGCGTSSNCSSNHSSKPRSV